MNYAHSARVFVKDLIGKEGSEGSVTVRRKIRTLKLFMVLILLLLDFALFWIFLTKPVNSIFLPEKIKLSNVSATSATLSWITPKAVQTSILASNSNYFPLWANLFGRKLHDDRDEKLNASGGVTLEGQPALGSSVKNDKKIAGEFSNHHVTVSKLKPNQTYYFAILVGFKNVKVVEVKTPSEGLTNQALRVIDGRIINSEGKRLAGVTVYYQAKDASSSSTVLSTITDNRGKWVFDIGNLPTEDLTSIFKVTDKTTQEIIATGGPLGSANFSTKSATLITWPDIQLK